MASDPSRATTRGAWIVDQAHWEGLPDGHTRATTVDRSPGPIEPLPLPNTGGLESLSSLLARRHADITVARRPLTDYANAAARAATATRPDLTEDQ